MPNSEAVTEPRYLERRVEALEAATGQTAASYSGAAPTPTPIFTSLASGAIGTTQVGVNHGLSYIPEIISIVMTTAGEIFQSQSPDATKVYLTADAASRQANIILGH